MLVGLATAPINARLLGQGGYGLLALWGTISGLGAIVFRFGLFSACRRVLAENLDERRERELVGAALVVGLAVGSSYALTMVALSWSIDRFFRVELGSMIRWVSPLLVFSPLPALLAVVSQGVGRTTVIAWTSILTRALLLAAIVVAAGSGRLSVGAVVAFGLAIQGVVCITAFVASLRGRFGRLPARLKEIWLYEKRYGVHLYMAQMLDQPASSIVGIMTGKFAGHVELGYFGIASTFCQCISALPRVLAVVVYKRLAHENAVPKALSRAVTIWLIVSSAGVLVLGPVVITLVFGESFRGAIPLLLPCAATAAVVGGYQLLNSYIAVRGRGQWARNCSLATGIASVGSAWGLVPRFGVYGAALSGVVAGVVFWACCAFYYEKLRRGTA